MNYNKLSYTYNNKLKRSPQRLNKWESATPASKLMRLRKKESTPIKANLTSMTPGKSTTSITAGLQDMTVSKSLLHNHLEINKTIRPSQQAAKEDKQLAEAEQQILDLGRIAIHIEELARGLEGIQNPSEPEVKGFAQEITGSAQDLLRLAFSYSSKIKHTSRTAIATTSGYDRNTATRAPESEFSETQYLFHPEVLSRMEEHRSKNRNKNLLRIAISGKIPNGFQRPGNQSYRNNRGGYFRGGHGNRDETQADHETGKIIWVPRDTPGHPQRNPWVRLRIHAKPPKEQAKLLVKARQEHVGRQYFEEWVSDTTYPVTPTHASKGIPPVSSPLGSHRHNGQGIPAFWNNTGDSEYGYNLCIPDIWKRGDYKDLPTTGNDTYQQICGQRRLQN
ncbi:hypothetical protein BB560_006480 [Smittium megazygosporum]|uniref:Uncharacterized protein n=1 Tax=Smittium megazygosporum TaxID=133381 RepID=A0A2T9Y562_9FUNG|nr:hypothetical protein BB560_006480 [Smittium megazygosporum]